MTNRLSALAVFIWLISARARVIKDLKSETLQMPCSAFTVDDVHHVDCSNRGLSELPEDINYEANILLLSKNKFEVFPDRLERFSKLKILDISGNRLSQTLPLYMQNWNIQSLNLSNNAYLSWMRNEGIFKIENLDLSNNKISIIETGSFEVILDLVTIDLAHNSIKEISPKLFNNLLSLYKLDLSYNYIEKLEILTPSLKVLNVSNCEIANLNNSSLESMSSLIEINLSSNNIEHIPDHISSSTLQYLDLSFNGLHALNNATFSSLPHLAVLDLRGNYFTEIWSTSYFASNPFLREVYVKGNLWNCEGFDVNLLLTYEFLTKEPSKVSDPNSLICYTPSNVTQKTWQQAYLETFYSEDTSSELNSLTVAAIMIGIIIGIVITSLICRALSELNKDNNSPQPTTDVNGVNTHPRVESVVMRIPLRDEDLPPTYDEALLMPRLNDSFHSLPDYIDVNEAAQNDRGYRRSRSFGDLTEYRPTRIGDRRSVRRPAPEAHFDG